MRKRTKVDGIALTQLLEEPSLTAARATNLNRLERADRRKEADAIRALTQVEACRTALLGKSASARLADIW